MKVSAYILPARLPVRCDPRSPHRRRTESICNTHDALRMRGEITQ